MNRTGFALRLSLIASLSLLASAKAFGVRRTEDPLALIPAGAATVGMVHWSELKTSPFGAKVFAEMDGVSCDGDAARFLAEAQLNPRDDVDTMVFAMAPAAASVHETALVFFEGRFDTDRLANAIVARGASKKMASGAAYYRLPTHEGSEATRAGDRGAVAFVNRGLIVAGSEDAVVAVLARRESGGTGGLMSGDGLGRHLSRVQKDASAWAMVDLSRFPATQRGSHLGEESGPAATLLGAMKNMSVAVFQAALRGHDVELAASGVSSDSETRGLIEDSLRGVLAMWRLAVADKSPELVPVIRRFSVENDGQAVSVRGTVPESFVQSLMGDRRAAH